MKKKLTSKNSGLLFWLGILSTLLYSNEAYQMTSTIYTLAMMNEYPQFEKCDSGVEIDINSQNLLLPLQCIRKCEEMGSECTAYSLKDGKCRFYEYVISPSLPASNYPGTTKLYVKPQHNIVKPDPSLKDVALGKNVIGIALTHFIAPETVIGINGNSSDTKVFTVGNPTNYSPGERVVFDVDEDGRYVFFNTFSGDSFCLCTVEVYALP